MATRAVDKPRLSLANEVVEVLVALCPRCQKGIWPLQPAKLQRMAGTSEFRLYHDGCQPL